MRPSPQALIEIHEKALFQRAYPRNRKELEAAEKLLRSFAKRVRKADLDEFEDPEISGIAGTRLTAVFSYAVARHLAEKHGDAVKIDWERHDQADRLAGTLPHLVPLLDDDSQVEAVVPWREWTQAAAGGNGRELHWLLSHLERMEVTDRLRADRYQGLQIPICWEFGESAATRTLMRIPASKIFYHKGPLIQRSEVSLAEIPVMAPLPVRRLSQDEGARMLSLARDTSAARFRELHGFTYGDPSHVYEVDAGRGVLFFVSGVPAEHRLPMRAYHAATIWKNGVPLGYFEGLSLFERMESGFNLYYTFRAGESAWLYRQLLKAMHQMLGVTCISVDPYQIGHENEEAVKSGAYWFYRKLGFRSVDAGIRELTAREEKKIAARPGYRTSPATLRRLVGSHMVYEFPGMEPGTWDRFTTRTLGMAAAAAMGRHFDGDLAAMRQMAVRAAVRMLGLNIDAWSEDERRVLAEWAPLLALICGMEDWAPEEKRLLGEILLAKAGAEESAYLRLLQWHSKLRDALQRLGSSQASSSRKKG